MKTRFKMKIRMCLQNTHHSNFQNFKKSESFKLFKTFLKKRCLQKILEVVPARVQGYIRNVDRLKNSELIHQTLPKIGLGKLGL